MAPETCESNDASADGGTGLLQKYTKTTAWRGGVQIQKEEEEDVKRMVRCEEKRNQWAKHWQCNTKGEVHFELASDWCLRSHHQAASSIHDRSRMLMSVSLHTSFVKFTTHHDGCTLCGAGEFRDFYGEETYLRARIIDPWRVLAVWCEWWKRLVTVSTSCRRHHAIGRITSAIDTLVMSVNT